MAAQRMLSDADPAIAAKITSVPKRPRCPDWKSQEHIRTLPEVKSRVLELGAHQDIVDGLIPARSLVVLVGDSGIGKSPLLYQLGVCVATGAPFLGRSVSRGLVLYMDFENGISPVASLLATIEQYLGVSLDGDDFLSWNYNDQGPSKDSYTSYLQKVRPTLCIIDSLGGFFPEMEEKSANATKAFQFLRGIIDAYGCSVLLVHHPRKPPTRASDGPKHLQDETLRTWFSQARGSSVLINGSDTRIGIDHAKPHPSAPNEEDGRFVLRGFTRLCGEIPMFFVQREFNADGDPVGYALAKPILLLPDQRDKYDKLPKFFRFKEAMMVYGKADQATSDWLKKLIASGWLKKIVID